MFVEKSLILAVFVMALEIKSDSNVEDEITDISSNSSEPEPIAQTKFTPNFDLESFISLLTGNYDNPRRMCNCSKFVNSQFSSF